MVGLIYCNVCNLDFRKGDAKAKLQRMFSIYLTKTKDMHAKKKITIFRILTRERSQIINNLRR